MSARPLVAALALAVAGFSFIGFGAYKKYHKPHTPAPAVVTPVAAPVPLPTPAPVAVVNDKECKPGKLPSGVYLTAAACDHLLKDRAANAHKAHAKPKVKAKVKAEPKAKAATVKKEAPAYVEAKVKPKPKKLNVATRLKEDAAGGKQISCAEVKWYVATYPKFILDQFAKLATEDQKERGKKCLGY